MKSHRNFISLTLTLALTAFLFLSQCSNSNTEGEQISGENNRQQAAEEPELANFMATMQYHTHKLALSIEASNADLAKFYLHELEEATETVINEVSTYEGHEISTLTETMLEPQFDPVDEAVESADWEKAKEKLMDLTDSCNACHQSTDHGFVAVEPGFDNNPWNQNFEQQ